jgi:two-component system CheB/CheR fusion protein
MPRSAIAVILPDAVSSPELLPSKLLELLKIDKEKSALLTIDKSSYEKILIILRTGTGNDFSNYKKNTLYRRIERRMTVHQIDTIGSYVRFLQENRIEIEILFKELLIGVTEFFRDPQVWEYLRDRVIPEWFTSANTPEMIRAWVPACSTGEEAYSLAIIFKEAMEKVKPDKNFVLQIFATDLDSMSVDEARKGIFPLTISESVTKARLDRYFVKENGAYRVKAEIREMIIFAVQNVILNPPFTKLEFLSCRNFLIYIETDLQRKLLNLFHYSMQPGGILLLGNAETIGSDNHNFTTIDQKLKIFKRTGEPQVAELFSMPVAFSQLTQKETKLELVPDNFQSVVERLLLKDFSPLGILINQTGDILYISGKSGQYLEPPTGKVNWNIFAMINEKLRSDFAILFRQATKSGKRETVNNLKIDSYGRIIAVDITIQLMSKSEKLSGMVLIVFDSKDIIEQINPIGETDIKGDLLEFELQKAREHLQSLQEEMQTSQEELKSSNEELQSTNEELQSTNEELTTSKEEMQSLNEELHTVNVELQMKVDEYSRINNDMENLLNSTEIATIFLDKELKIRRFTHQATKIAKLIQSDIGRPFTDLASEIEYPELVHDAREVLRTLVYSEKPVFSPDGKWFNVRIIPYRTFDDHIDGLVITFTDITKVMNFKESLKDTALVLRTLINSSVSVAFAISIQGKIVEFNPAAELLFGRKHEEVIDRNYFDLFIPNEFHKATELEMMGKFEEVNPTPIENIVKGGDGENLTVKWSFCKMYSEEGKVAGIIAIGANVTPYKV